MLVKVYKHLKIREGKLKKILTSIVLIITLSGCAETMAFLGPAGTAAGGGNIARSTLTSVVDYGIKKSTGKSSFEHAINYAEKHNPDRKKLNAYNSSKQQRAKFALSSERECLS